MPACQNAPLITEVDLPAGSPPSEALLTSDTPWVARGYLREWPVVQHGKQGDEKALAYLTSFYQGRPVSAFLAEPESKGRFFYNEDVTGFNFVQVDTRLDQVFSKLLALITESNPPSLYVGSTQTSAWLPGFNEAHPLPVGLPGVMTSLWIGNQARIAAHFDFPRNIAGCVIGCRKFTLFPPDQVTNLYVGPWDLTPAGQPISMVDFDNPDYDLFPRFAEAEANAAVTELGPGDVIYIPNMWWHQVESLSAINGLVNFWWQETPGVYGSPTEALKHAFLSIRSLPLHQRNALKSLFDHYVFAEDTQHLEHLPEASWGRLDKVSDSLARQLRAELTNSLKR
ncbi:MAG: cupin-like domain-containing protein [Gammaproteobacteria bacterium]|nr:cupin-like domain-containing protein [Pseudomonadota bacterium]NCG06015.1 cupin-like domain-containing protein [Gammaproteobacteria bacterium]